MCVGCCPLSSLLRTVPLRMLPVFFCACSFGRFFGVFRVFLACPCVCLSVLLVCFVAAFVWYSSRVWALHAIRSASVNCWSAVFKIWSRVVCDSVRFWSRVVCDSVFYLYFCLRLSPCSVRFGRVLCVGFCRVGVCSDDVPCCLLAFSPHFYSLASFLSAMRYTD